MQIDFTVDSAAQVYLANGTAVQLGDIVVAGVGGTFAPTWFDTPAAALPHTRLMDDKRRHFVREEIEACKALGRVDVLMTHEAPTPFWVTLPASAAVGALLGLIFGLPSLRLRGLYLAVSTLALHFIVIHLGSEYETKRGFSTGIVVDPPVIGPWTLYDGRAWYFVLLGAAAATVLFSLNLLRSRTGRAWRAIHGREAVAGALGIDVRRAKLSAFVISSMLTAVAGCLFAYFRGFVSVEAFSLFLTIQYVAMIIIGGMGSILGALLGTVFVTLFPYLIEWLMQALGLVEMLAAVIFAVNYSAFGLMMILFLVFEAQGLVGIWRRVQAWLLLWPFRHKPLGEAR